MVGFGGYVAFPAFAFERVSGMGSSQLEFEELAIEAMWSYLHDHQDNVIFEYSRVEIGWHGHILLLFYPATVSTLQRLDLVMEDHTLSLSPCCL